MALSCPAQLSAVCSSLQCGCVCCYVAVWLKRAKGGVPVEGANVNPKAAVTLADPNEAEGEDREGSARRGAEFGEGVSVDVTVLAVGSCR